MLKLKTVSLQCKKFFEKLPVVKKPRKKLAETKILTKGESFKKNITKFLSQSFIKQPKNI
jgi:hypothetical protein